MAQTTLDSTKHKYMFSMLKLSSLKVDLAKSRSRRRVVNLSLKVDLIKSRSNCIPQDPSLKVDLTKSRSRQKVGLTKSKSQKVPGRSTFKEGSVYNPPRPCASERVEQCNT